VTNPTSRVLLGSAPVLCAQSKKFFHSCDLGLRGREITVYTYYWHVTNWHVTNWHVTNWHVTNWHVTNWHVTNHSELGPKLRMPLILSHKAGRVCRHQIFGADPGRAPQIRGAIVVPMTLDRGYESDPGRLKVPGDLADLFQGELLDEETVAAIAEWVKGGKPVDHALELLRTAGFHAVAGGTAVFTKSWNSGSVRGRRKALRSDSRGRQGTSSARSSARPLVSHFLHAISLLLH